MSAWSQASSNWIDDDEAVRLGAFARRLDPVELLQPQVHDLALDGGHRLELDRLVPRQRLLRGAQRKGLERRPPPRAVTGRVDDNFLPILRMAAVHDRVREVLNRVDR